MRIVCISDTHEQHAKLGELPPGDVLIHAGDMTNVGNDAQFRNVASWLRAQPHRHKIAIPGNHDIGIERKPRLYREKVFRDIHLLIDSRVVIDGVKFWGSPWTPTFYNWAFMRSEEALYKHWSKTMPAQQDVVITHGPPHGYTDKTEQGIHIGSTALLRILRLRRPHVLVCGHNHAGRGVKHMPESDTVAVNAAVLDERYALVNRPIVLEYDVERRGVVAVEFPG